MSDYLWDKTGEPDADIARLEELLGELRHNSARALELPPEIEALAVRKPLRVRAAWLAVAAGLLLAVMASAFMALRSDRTSNNMRASQDSQGAATHDATPNSPTPQLAAPSDMKPTPRMEIRDARALRQLPMRKGEPQRSVVRLVAVRPEREFEATASNSANDHEGVAVKTLSGRVWDTSSAELAAQRQLAKEQLVYALHLTSFKLKEVHKKTQGIADSKQTFNRRN